MGIGDRQQASAILKLWQYVLDLALIAWIVRPLLFILLLGSFVLVGVPQAQDLLVEAAANPLEGLQVTALLFFVWALPTHYAARLLLESDDRLAQRIQSSQSCYLMCLKEWAPRILGFATFGAMIWSTFHSRDNMPTVMLSGVTSDDVKQRLLWLAAILSAAALLFLLYAKYRRSKIAVSSGVSALEGIAFGVLTPLRFAQSYFGLTLSTRVAPGQSNLGPMLLIILFLVFGFLPMMWPYWFAHVFPRAASVPFVMGGWLPVLALLSGLGRRFHAPLIGFALALLVLLPLLFGDHYEIRLKPTGTNAASAQISLNDAVEAWKGAGNNCESNRCRRPIIIAAAGGASRAGFFTASLIGQLLDDKLIVGGKGHGLKPEEVRNRLFAISSVSGSSVGAVMATAALSQSQDGRQPCKRTADLWYGLDTKDVNLTDFAKWGWRACLESLTSGDFLTPVFIGFMFHDVFRFLGWEDRGVLLERSLEERFRQLIDPNPNGPAGDCTMDLSCTFLSLGPTARQWLPLLVLNSTSVETGQRIVTSRLAPTFKVPSEAECPTSPRPTRETSSKCPIFEYGKSLHELLPESYDVRLSTAAHNSARFPLLSPPGAIRNASGGLVDRVVDGGYFENLGAQTATELAEAMMAVDDSLEPLVLVISNDPQLENAEAYKYDKPTKQPDGWDRSAVTDLQAPLLTVLNTRNARALLAVADISAILDHYHSEDCNFAHIQVQGERDLRNPGKVREMSWSWWLSKPVQIYLHEQTELLDGAPDPINRKSAQLILDAIGSWSKPITDSPASAKLKKVSQSEDCVVK